MDDIQGQLSALREYLDETHTMLHAGEVDAETLGATFFAVSKLTEITESLAAQVRELGGR